MPSWFNLLRATFNSSTLETLPPSLFESLLFSLEISKRICLSWVPANDPLMFAFASCPRMAVVSSKLNPATLATGPTMVIAPVNFSMSSAVLAKLRAITSVIRAVSLASNPKALSVPPATSAV